MIQKVPPQVDFIALEHRILNFWEQNQIFSKRVQANRGQPRWSFIDGPITANNPMGVHHAWGRTLKDLYQRYQAMTGHELRYQNGFDCQGLWVELEVEKELGFHSKKEIEDYGVERFVQRCVERVKKYAAIQTDQSIRLGYWMDWENSYYTLSDENNYTIWAFLKRLFERSKIYRGSDVVPWSGRSGTAYSQMEIIEGRRLVAHESVFVRFPLPGREMEYLLVWTTTPWTLTANVAAAVNVNMNYLRLRCGDDTYYFAEDNLEYQRLEKQYQDPRYWVEGVPKLKTIAQLFKERGGYSIDGTLPGSALVGWEYEGPFDYLEAAAIPGGYPLVDPELEKEGRSARTGHRVIDGGKDSVGNDVVVGGEGTGIVHIAPGCGDVDHRIGQRLGLVNLAPLDEAACYLEKFGWLKGKNATAETTVKAILGDLKERGFLVHAEQYPHVYPHCWRSGDELVFRLVDEWYIKMDWREEIKKTIEQITWIPSWGREREAEWLDNMGDWMISKKRFWGLALPIWTFADDSFWVVGSREELQDLAVEGWEEFEGHSPHRPWIDRVKIRHPESGLVGTRVADVGNPWLDAGIVPYSTLNYISDRSYWEEWFPGDFVTESLPGQFRNWFYSLLAMSTIMENRAPFRTLLGHALVMDEEGREMHKSWGNAIWFDEAAEKMGVDVMRWMYARQKVEKNLLFGYGTAREVRRKLITLWNAYSFFATYAAVDDFSPLASQVTDEERTILDRWILAKLYGLVQVAVEAFEAYRVNRFMEPFERFLEDLSNWYIRRSRRRFWKSEDDSDKQAAYHTLYEVLLTTARLLAPVLPFVTEEIYQNLARRADPSRRESIHLEEYPQPDPSRIDSALIRRVDGVKQAVELGRSARNQARLKIRQPLSKFCFYSADEDLAQFMLTNQSLIQEELNVKTVERVTGPEELVRPLVRPNLPVLGQKFGAATAPIRGALEKIDAKSILETLQSAESFSLSAAGEEITLTREDLLIETQSREGFSSVAAVNLTVGLATTLNESLIQEGIVRDLIRHVQIMRKDANFAVEDRITIYGKFSGSVGAAVRNFEDYFRAETLAVDLVEDFRPGEYEHSFKVDQEIITLGIERTEKGSNGE